MKILFSNNQTINFYIDNSPLGQVYQKIYKHLTHVPIPYRDWDSPYYLDGVNYIELINRLSTYAKKLSLTIDQERCFAKDQKYFNDIHKIYETNYNGNPDWLDFHQHIHMCESYLQPKPKFLYIDYREKAGLLERPYEPSWMEHSITTIKAGTIFSQWSELGKSPYAYWMDQEPADINRMCQLSKPWSLLRPKLMIALEDIDLLANKKITEFESWWQNYSKDWCNHWNLPSWTVYDMFAVTKIGQVENVEKIKEQLKSQAIPSRVLL